VEWLEMSDDLMTAYLVGFHKRDDEFAAMTLTKDETIRLQVEEIARLRYLLQEQLACQEGELKAQQQMVREAAQALNDEERENEQLRGLLRECCASLGWQGHNEQCLDPAYNDYDPECPECLLLKRVRKALSDE
jgi:hypothetical protein